MAKSKVKFGLAHKITILVISLVAIIMGVVSYFSIVREEALKYQEMNKRMTEVANMVAALKLIEPLAGESVAWPVFREFIKVVRNLNPNILTIAIVGNDGEIKAYTLNPSTAVALDASLNGIDESPEALAKLKDHPFPAGNTVKISGDIMVEDARVATVNLRFSLLALKREIMMAKIRNILLTLIMMGLGFGGAVWVSRTVTRPIAQLNEAMARVAKGDLGVTAPVRSRDEIGLLTQSFNTMVQDLKEKVRIKDAFEVVADELKEVEKIKESFQLYISKEAQERLIDPSMLAFKGGEGNTHPVVVLFADLSQVAQQITTQSAATMAETVSAYFNKFVATCFQYEGQIYKLTESLFIVVFGVPHVHADDDKRAILTAVTIQKALAEINKDQIRKNEPPLFISLGIATGEACGSLLTAKGLSAVEVIRDYLAFTQKMSEQAFSVVMVAGDVFRRVTNLIRGEKVEDLQMPDTGDTLEVYRITGAKF